ncbi:hypothetical protein E4U41_000378 [Claviceps citrina]|nr:hypothetical protein E4U41_000378 [Claviceps citrina]
MKFLALLLPLLAPLVAADGPPALALPYLHGYCDHGTAGNNFCEYELGLHTYCCSQKQGGPFQVYRDIRGPGLRPEGGDTCRDGTGLILCA